MVQESLGREVTSLKGRLQEIERLIRLGLVGGELQAKVRRLEGLLGRLVNESDLGNILLGIEPPPYISILQATATADLTLTTTATSIIGNGDSNKVRLLLPTPGDWFIEAACDFEHTALGAGTALGELFVNDSGTPSTGKAELEQSALHVTVTQHWKVTTTVTNTPVELKARKTVAGGTAIAQAAHTRLSVIGSSR